MFNIPYPYTNTSAELIEQGQADTTGKYHTEQSIEHFLLFRCCTVQWRKKFHLKEVKDHEKKVGLKCNNKSAVQLIQDYKGIKTQTLTSKCSQQMPDGTPLNYSKHKKSGMGIFLSCQGPMDIYNIICGPSKIINLTISLP